MTTISKAQNILIKDVTLNWAKLDKPVSPFGTEQYEVQIEFDASRKAEMEANHLTVKERDGKYFVSLKRKAKRSDGSDNGKPRVVDAQKQPIEGTNIGNGSKGNVIVYVYPYEVMGRTGVGSSITAVQVTDLVEYVSGGVDFDVEGDAPAADEAQADMF